MLQHILVISSSGLVLFQKQFHEGISQPSLTGSLLTALLSLCRTSIQLPASYISMSKMAVGIAADSDRTGVACAVFGDVSDGMELLVLLARSILATFLRRFLTQLSQPLVDIRAYNVFQQDLGSAFRSAAITIAEELHLQYPTLINCALIHHGRVAHATRSEDFDSLGLVANLNAFLQTATDYFSLCNDQPREIALQLTHTGKLHGAKLLAVTVAPFVIVVILPASLDAGVFRNSLSHSATRLKEIGSRLSSLSERS